MELEESYQLYKNVLRETLNCIYSNNISEINLHMSESPTSYLTYIKYGLSDFKGKYPNALNEAISVPDRKIPYINRIAGFININNGDFEIIDSQAMHTNIKEHYNNDMATFMLFDGMYGRSVYISIDDEKKLNKAYDILKREFSHDWVDCYILDLSAGDEKDTFIKTIVYDSNGRKYNADILQLGKDVPWIRNYLNERFSININDINKILKISGVKNG